MRAMKNYAGHRLSPWLGHLMVSRTETARPLLTPGEIIQLSPDEEIVMVGGVPPIRAMKARYFTDPRFTVRLLPPRSEEHTSELQSLMRISYAVFCLKKKTARSTVLPPIKNRHNEIRFTMRYNERPRHT